jgi:TolA-binding protein
MAKNLVKSPLNLICLSFLFLTACEGLMTRGQVREVEQKHQIQDQVVSLQKTNADVTNRFADIESDLRAMNGRVEVLENKLDKSGQERDKLKASSDQSNSENSKRIMVLQDEIEKLHEQVGALTAELTAIKTAAPEVSSDKASKKDLYDLGEEHFEKKDWKKAILNFQKYRDTNPKSKKFPEATYKIGVSFQELGLKDEARTFFDEVISKFPNSADAKRAKTRLKSLKK